MELITWATRSRPRPIEPGTFGLDYQRWKLRASLGEEKSIESYTVFSLRSQRRPHRLLCLQNSTSFLFISLFFTLSLRSLFLSSACRLHFSFWLFGAFFSNMISQCFLYNKLPFKTRKLEWTAHFARYCLMKQNNNAYFHFIEIGIPFCPSQTIQ